MSLDLWQRGCERLAAELPEQQFNTWIRPLAATVSPATAAEPGADGTQAVTTLTVSGNGATVNGAPAALTANGFFRLRFDGVLGGWYRLG